jgi:hypothetical protein
VVSAAQQPRRSRVQIPASPILFRFFSAFYQHRPDNSTNQNTVANETFAVANETFRYVSCTRECLIEKREHAECSPNFDQSEADILT